MKILRAVQTHLTPTMERHKLYLVDSRAGYYLFRSKDKKKNIVFEKGRYSPACFRVQYWFKGCPPIFIERFDSKFNFCGSFVYQTQNELEFGFQRMAKDADIRLIKLFEEFSQGYTAPTYDMYQQLSLDVEEQAKYYARIHGLKLELDSDLASVDQNLILLRGTSLSDRHRCFLEQQKEIIALTAYLGELIRLKSNKDLKWGWQTQEAIVTENMVYPAQQRFMLIHNQNPCYSPLLMVLEAWNFMGFFVDARLINKITRIL